MENEDLKYIFRTAINDGYMKQIVGAYNSTDDSYELLITKLSNSLSSKYGFDKKKVYFMFQCVLSGLGCISSISVNTVTEDANVTREHPMHSVERKNVSTNHNSNSDPLKTADSSQPLTSRSTAKERTKLKDLDPLFEEAAKFVIHAKSVSTAMIQRRFLVGYNRAGHILDQLETAGIVGPFSGSLPREVYISDANSLQEHISHLLG